MVQALFKNFPSNIILILGTNKRFCPTAKRTDLDTELLSRTIFIHNIVLDQPELMAVPFF
ncbi:hypothetical protein VCV18_012742 [Metarhizium anisopliae]